MTESLDRICSALACVDPTDRDVWLKVGMALHVELGDAGFDLWDEWSQTAENYHAASVRAVWRSFRVGRMSIATLFHFAKLAGWHSDLPPDPDREAKRQATVVRMADEREKREQEAMKAACKAADLWHAGKPGVHPYLTRKQVSGTETLRVVSYADAVRVLGYRPSRDGDSLEGPLLIAPVKAAGRLSTLELIDGEGRKSAIRGGVKKAGYWATGKLSGVVLIAEGVATALSLHMATGCVAVAALSCWNLRAVSDALSRFPLVICGDNGNGSSDALKVGAICARPVAIPDVPDADWNDMHVRHGLENVRKALLGPVAEAQARMPRVGQENGATGLRSAAQETLGGYHAA